MTPIRLPDLVPVEPWNPRAASLSELELHALHEAVLDAVKYNSFDDPHHFRLSEDATIS